MGWRLRPSAHSAVTEVSFFKKNITVLALTVWGMCCHGYICPQVTPSPPRSAVAVDKQLLGVTFAPLLIPR